MDDGYGVILSCWYEECRHFFGVTGGFDEDIWFLRRIDRCFVEVTRWLSWGRRCRAFVDMVFLRPPPFLRLRLFHLHHSLRRFLRHP